MKKYENFEKAWSSALRESNNMAHIYNEQAALELIERINTDYYPMLAALRDEICKNWINSML